MFKEALMILVWLMTLILVGTLPAAAAPTTFETIDVPFPGASTTGVTGRQARVLVGGYVDANGADHGFVRHPHGQIEMLPLLTPQDSSAAGITGWFIASGARPDGGAITASFILANGTFTRLQVPREGGVGTPFNYLTEALAINDAGVVVGDFRSGVDGRFRGFVYNPAADPRYTTLEAPETPLSTALLWISPAGRILLRAIYADGRKRHYLWEAETFTEVPPIPDLPNVDLVARTDTGRLAGNAGTTGFVWDGTTLEEIAVPEARLTELLGLQEQEGKVTVYGRYIGADDVSHGFVATLGSTRQRPRRSEKPQPEFQQADCSPASKGLRCRGR